MIVEDPDDPAVMLRVEGFGERLKFGDLVPSDITVTVAS